MCKLKLKVFYILISSDKLKCCFQPLNNTKGGQVLNENYTIFYKIKYDNNGCYWNYWTLA